MHKILEKYNYSYNVTTKKHIQGYRPTRCLASGAYAPAPKKFDSAVFTEIALRGVAGTFLEVIFDENTSHTDKLCCILSKYKTRLVAAQSSKYVHVQNRY